MLPPALVPDSALGLASDLEGALQVSALPVSAEQHAASRCAARRSVAAVSSVDSAPVHAAEHRAPPPVEAELPPVAEASAVWRALYLAPERQAWALPVSRLAHWAL